MGTNEVREPVIHRVPTPFAGMLLGELEAELVSMANHIEVLTASLALHCDPSAQCRGDCGWGDIDEG